MSDTTTVHLREICGVRSGDKGDSSDLTLFTDDQETFDLLVERLTPERVAQHLGDTVKGEVVRYLAPNVLGIKFVCSQALGGGGPLSLRSDNLGKALGGALLRMRVDLPADVVTRSARYGRRAPLPGAR